jgi:hypothetical protein
MKQIRAHIYLFIVAIYVVSNIGLPVYYHYCGGELESVSALFKADGCCGEEEEEEDSDCCQNETKIIAQKSETSFHSVHFNFEPASQDLQFPDALPVNAIASIEEPSAAKLSEFHPPGTGRDILKSKSVLII